ncbi:MAG: PAS domain S-box protein, partial [Candidatus Hodarchaeota archaeon]
LVNPALNQWAKEVGLKTDFIGRTILNAFPFLSDNVLEEYRQVFNTGDPLITVEYIKIKGKKYIVEVRKIPIFSEGEVAQTITVIRDITERKQAEYMLNQSKVITDNIKEALILFDMDGSVSFVNPAYEKLTGYKAKELLGKNGIEIAKRTVIKHEVEKILDNFGKALKGVELPPILTYLKHKDDREIPIEFTVSYVRDETEKTVQIVAVITDITERKKAEAALQESEAKYSALVEYATDGVAIIQDGIFKFANKALAELSGYAIDKLVGRPFLDLLTPESRDLLTQRYQLRMAGENVSSVYEAKIQCKDGLLKDVEISAGVIQYQGGSADMVFARDITTRKLAEEELHKLSRAVEQSPSIVMITDTQGIIEYVNPKFTQITGYLPEEIIGINAQGLGEQFSEEEQQMWNTIYSGNEWRGEFLNKKKTGDLYWEHASISPIKNRKGVITHFLKVAENITAQKQVEEALRASEERYRSLFEESPVSLWEEDFSAIKKYIDNLRCKGVKNFRKYFEKHPEAVAQCTAKVKVVDVNKTTLEMYEASNKEELLRGLSQVFGEETYDIFREELISLTEGKTIFESEAINRTLTGNELQIHLRWSVAPGYEDTWKKILISILDITPYKQAEQAKREFEKSQTNFIEITSHELRTPLTAIRGYTEFLNKHLDELDQARRNQSFEMINRNVQRLERLIRGVSTLGLLERGVFRLDTKDVNFCDILNEALQPYQIRLGQQLEYQNCPERMSVIIKVDPDRLLQVLDNLLENAVKQTPQDRRKIIVTPDILPNVIRVQVTDNGAGIAPEDLDNIFKPFTAIPTKYSAGGTGIGLYLARMLTEAHGGTLTAHSKGKEGGATFIMELPMKSEN